jgi:1-aminocyclopropane-1-carboxylate synthase
VDQDFTYGEGPGGTTRLRDLLSKFLNTHFKITESKLIDKNIITTPGVYAALEQISWAVANPGEGILVGRPLYPGFIKGFSYSRSKYVFFIVP